jgi:formaldehyde-activating enzyme involved in methanogenesis
MNEVRIIIENEEEYYIIKVSDEGYYYMILAKSAFKTGLFKRKPSIQEILAEADERKHALIKFKPEEIKIFNNKILYIEKK